MTFGPWVVTGAPDAGPVAVVEGFFQTICESGATVSGLASATRAGVDGWRGLAVPGTVPTSQTTWSPSTPPPEPVAMRVNVVPSTAGTVTWPPSAGAAPKLRTIRRKG